MTPAPALNAPRTGMVYQPQLDGLRALAVTVVIMSHTWLDAGHRGVQLFFVLSGFLITGILLEDVRKLERRETTWRLVLQNFYWRRLLRIAPPYYILLFVFLCVPAFSVKYGITYHLFFLSNLWFAKIEAWQPYALAPMWSLGVEQQFYAFWPLVLLWGGSRRIGLVSIAMVILAVTGRWGMAVAGWNTETTVWVLPISSFDALGLGALLAVGIENEKFRVALERAAVLCGLFAVLADLQLLQFSFRTSFSLIEFLWAVFFVGVVSYVRRGGTWAARALSIPPLVYIGRISYSMYLVHSCLAVHFMPAASRLMSGHRLERGPLLFFSVFGLAVLCAAVMWRFVESPLSKFKFRHAMPPQSTCGPAAKLRPADR